MPTDPDFGRKFSDFCAAWIRENGLKVTNGAVTLSRAVLADLGQRFHERYESAKPQRVKRVRPAFVQPNPSEVTEYGRSINFNVDGEQFCAHYASKGWKVGKALMVDWKAAVVTWKKKHREEEKILSDARPPNPSKSIDRLYSEPAGDWLAWRGSIFPGVPFDSDQWSEMSLSVKTEVLKKIPV